MAMVEAAESPAAVVEARPAQRRTLVAGVVGNVMEWYDFGLYAFLARFIARLFFPSEDELASLIAAFGVFGAGFLMRPVGAALFGHYGDRYGRKQALAASVILMAIPTGLIGLLPTYAQAGIAAPVLLTLMRLLQGISVGGEYTGSMTFLVEHAPAGRRGYIGSWTAFSCVFGTLLGSGTGALVTALLSDEAILAWGWRLPFLLGVLVGGVGLYLRYGAEETPSFKKLEQQEQVAHSPLVEAVRGHKKVMLIAILLNWLNVASFYLVFSFMPAYLSQVANMSDADALRITTINLVILAIFVPFMGWLSDRIGRKPVQIGVATGYLLLSYPLFLVLAQGHPLSCLLAQSVFAILSAGIGGTISTLLVELIPARARYSVLSLGYNLAAAVLGGGAPALAGFLIRETGLATVPSFYLMLSAAGTLGALLMIPETHRRPLE